MIKIKVEAPSFPFPMCMLPPLSEGGSHDVTVCQVHIFISMLSLYTYVSETNV